MKLTLDLEFNKCGKRLIDDIEQEFKRNNQTISEEFKNKVCEESTVQFTVNGLNEVQCTLQTKHGIKIVTNIEAKDASTRYVEMAKLKASREAGLRLHMGLDFVAAMLKKRVDELLVELDGRERDAFLQIMYQMFSTGIKDKKRAFISVK